jgi:type IV pilus assembly protein PilX
MYGKQQKSPHSQRGAVLIFALIALTVLLIGAVVMVRSMNVTLTNAGNAGFKRDLTNQGERAVQAAYDEFVSGDLQLDATRFNSRAAANYSASLLASNEQGLPRVLLDDAAFTGAGFAAANDIVVNAQSVRIRYVVDRMCVAAFVGAPDPANCTMAGSAQYGGSVTEQQNVNAAALQPVYRVSVRVTGPRGTEAYFQSTFAM